MSGEFDENIRGEKMAGGKIIWDGGGDGGKASEDAVSSSDLGSGWQLMLSRLNWTDKKDINEPIRTEEITCQKAYATSKWLIRDRIARVWSTKARLDDARALALSRPWRGGRDEGEKQNVIN